MEPEQRIPLIAAQHRSSRHGVRNEVRERAHHLAEEEVGVHQEVQVGDREGSVGPRTVLEVARLSVCEKKTDITQVGTNK